MIADAAREHLAAGRDLTTQVSGHSMWPFLRDGQRVRIVRAERIQLGDVVLVAQPLVLHRVIAIAGDRLTLKGDARPRADGAVDRAQVIGRLDVVPCALFAHVSRLGGAPLAAVLRRMRLFLAPKIG